MRGSEHEFKGMRVHVILILQIGVFVLSCVEVDERDRDEKWNKTVVIPGDHFLQFLCFPGRKLLLEIPRQMLQYIRVLPDRCP